MGTDNNFVFVFDVYTLNHNMRTAWLRAASKSACLDRTSHCSGEDVYEGNETKETGKDEDRMTTELSRRNQRRDIALKDEEPVGKIII